MLLVCTNPDIMYCLCFLWKWVIVNVDCGPDHFVSVVFIFVSICKECIIFLTFYRSNKYSGYILHMYVAIFLSRNYVFLSFLFHFLLDYLSVKLLYDLVFISN